ncbi:rhamnan synthesis F family protein [Paenibacillus sacheonensis]|uniref:Rhamnan synthesis protein F n=1 Tax=Paenibacillus sacheonensis TaxID=742054 RepID=A0A7X4YV65_9BACL|nr:rhamnan synthesis F family protein [Paenibacillus sacheonensis]MBM7566464.1 rhamnosyltransferase [Paenibacillus sacheonensis]NBC73147.1 hypothetical protein [Paenibacillus sacheonensis]
MAAKNRLGIFQMHDADGVVDRYIEYLLDDLRRNVNHLVIVCNGGINEEGRSALKKYTTDVFIRKNEGFDAAAIKETLEVLLGWERVYQYDELVLVNNSCFGPLYPLESVFETMEQKDVDFWGLTEQPSLPNSFSSPAIHSRYLPSHIQTYFLVIRHRLLHSEDFRRIWDTLPQIYSCEEAVIHYELRFTVFFSELGYIHDTYVDSGLFTVMNPEDNYEYVMYESYRLIAECKCPLIKRENFSRPLNNTLEASAGEDMTRAFAYIRDNTTYNVDLIWNHLLRVCNITDLYEIMHLNFIFPTKTRGKSEFIHKKSAIIMHMYYPDLVEECFKYIKGIPEEFDVIVTTSREDTKQQIEQLLAMHRIRNGRIVLSRNRGREMSALLVECKDLLMQYEYLCFVHDKKVSGAVGVSKIGQSFMDLLWTNTLKSSAYIWNVLDCFEENARLGWLAPPAPHHASYLGVNAEGWTSSYPATKNLSERLGLTGRLTEEKAPFALGTAFWCRSQALRPLFEHGFEYEDFAEEPMPIDGTISHAIERIFPYVAQHEGYYSGVMMTDEYAAIQSVNYRYMLNELLKQIKKEKGIPHYSYTFKQAMDMASSAHVREFILRHKKVFIYGTGDIASRYAANLVAEKIDFEGFIVSNGHRQQQELFNRPVYELTKDELDSDIGIIVALNPVHQREVLFSLKEKGYKNLFIM